VFETKFRSSLAEYTLSYQNNWDLDYEAIQIKSEQLVQGMSVFDDRLHQTACGDVVYYFKCLKDDMLLVAALDQVPEASEIQVQDRFEKLYTEIEKCLEESNTRIDGNLTYILTLELNKAVREINPQTLGEIELKSFSDDLESGKAVVAETTAIIHALTILQYYMTEARKAG
jgi:hypothetical protein